MSSQSEVLSCRLRGRRAAEYASGVFDDFVADIISAANSQLAVAVATLNSEDKVLVTSDWTNATASQFVILKGFFDFGAA